MLGSRFLRLRGDRPCDVRVLDPLFRVPPPARRSTPATRGRPASRFGSSACAEIDPHPACLAIRSRRFLRLRGDRPSGGVRTNSAFMVPPPARRSTRFSVAIPSWWTGSSACAEIDPGTRLVGQGSMRFLRLRGDRPGEATAIGVAPEVPPPARRSTLVDAMQAVEPFGSSACAEIDPVHIPSRPRKTRFLRLRGDRPQHRAGRRYRPLVPPPARRSTLRGNHGAPAQCGSSACAEIDPDC